MKIPLSKPPGALVGLLVGGAVEVPSVLTASSLVVGVTPTCPPEPLFATLVKVATVITLVLISVRVEIVSFVLAPVPLVVVCFPKIPSRSQPIPPLPPAEVVIGVGVTEFLPIVVLAAVDDVELGL